MDIKQRHENLLSCIKGLYDLAKLPDFPKGPDRDPERVLMSELLGFDVDLIFKHPKVAEISKLVDFKRWDMEGWHIQDVFFELTYLATKDLDIEVLANRLKRMSEAFFEIEQYLERKQESVLASFDSLTLALANDPSYYYSWQANIAMQIRDTFRNAGYELPELHKLANDSAKNFLDMLINQGDKK